MASADAPRVSSWVEIEREALREDVILVELRRGCDPLPPLPFGGRIAVRAGNEQDATRGPELARDELEKCCLAAAGRAGHEDPISGVHPQRSVVEDCACAFPI